MKRVLAVIAVLAALVAGRTAWAEHDKNEKDVRSFGATLRPAAGGPEDGSGHVKFRQPKDEDWIAYLKIRLQQLLPHHSYYLQRATDVDVNDECAGENWLTLGHGSVVREVPIGTDEKGNGPAVLFRDLAVVQGTRSDIQFRVLDALTGAVVLASDCYQFTVLQ